MPGDEQDHDDEPTTVFEHVAQIRDLIVLGGGPIGVELAQGFARLGARVQLVEMARLLPRDDAEAVELVRASLLRDGVALHEGSAATEVQRAGDRVRLAIRTAAGATQWLDGCLALDERNFVKTGADLSPDELERARWPLTRPPYLLETTLPGVFAVGDVRAGNVKRVASAVGEGAMSVQFVHEYLRVS